MKGLRTIFERLDFLLMRIFLMYVGVIVVCIAMEIEVEKTIAAIPLVLGLILGFSGLVHIFLIIGDFFQEKQV